MISSALTFVLCLKLIDNVVSHDIYSSTKLFNDLFVNNNYNPELIPIVDGEPLNVNINLFLEKIVHFEQISQSLAANVWLPTNWSDKRLVWNPEKYGGVTDLQVNPTTVWRPDITLYNSADGRHQLAEELESQVNVRIYFNGTIKWSPVMLYTVSCPMKLKYFPFDVQACNVQLGSWTYNRDKLRLTELVNSTTALKNLQISSGNIRDPDNHIWYLHEVVRKFRAVKYDLDSNDIYDDVKFYFILKRNYKMFLLNIVLTVSLLAVLALLSFWIPVGTGERLSLSLSIIIAISVYQLLAAGVIPTGTDTIPILSVFLAIIVILVTFTVMVTMGNLKIKHELQLNRPPEWLFKILVYKFGKIIKVKRYHEYKSWLQLENHLSRKACLDKQSSCHGHDHNPDYIDNWEDDTNSTQSRFSNASRETRSNRSTVMVLPAVTDHLKTNSGNVDLLSTNTNGTVTNDTISNRSSVASLTSSFPFHPSFRPRGSTSFKPRRYNLTNNSPKSKKISFFHEIKPRKLKGIRASVNITKLSRRRVNLPDLYLGKNSKTFRKIYAKDSSANFELNCEMKRADLEWKLLGLIIDRLCMLFSMLAFSMSLGWLLFFQNTFDSQLEKIYDQIERDNF